MNNITNFSLEDIKRDVIRSHRECSNRGLLQSGKWAAEINYALDQVTVTDTNYTSPPSEGFAAEFDHYMLAKSYFDLKEYDRSAHFVQNCKSPKAFFLHVYSRFLGGEKRRLDDATDASSAHSGMHIDHLKTLRQELQLKYKDNQLDGYALYLYGVVLRKLELVDEARRMLVEAVTAEPLVWSAWQELALLVTDKDMIQCLAVPEHWMRQFFVAHASLELQLNEEARELYFVFRDNGFSKSTYVLSQIAMSYHNMREVDEAVAAFANLQKVDPYRLDNVDTYSNLLYVKEMRMELAHLAHNCCDVDKYRVETCTVIGNYYSLRGQHEKAVLYFQRALKLNPSYLSAWTLMGHEYMELKNTCAAIQAYRTAIEVNKRDYRAYYGLGQTYEILKMPLYSLYYYRQAQVLRPNDSRMLVAIGEAYEKLDRLQEAKKCFFRAHSVGDVEGLALCKLAKVFEKLSEEDQAAGAYVEFITETELQGAVHSNSLEDVSNAYKYLAYYYLRHMRLDEAYDAAQKCAEYPETREEGKGLLRQISEQRSKTGSGNNTPNLDLAGSVTTDRGVPAAVLSANATPLSQLSPIHLTYTP